jgi:hypothetical protein
MAQGNLLLNIAVKNQQALGKVNNQLTQLQSSGIKLGTVLKGAAAGLAAFGAVRIGSFIVNTTKEFEDLRTTLSSVTGSSKEGAEAFRFISEFATKTQFGVDDLTKTFIKLKSAGIEPTEELLTTFTDAAAVTNDQIGSLEAVTDLFSRTVSGGLGLEEIQRLGDRGIPVLAILEEKLGLTRAEISEYGKTAEGAAEITKAFAEGINERFGGATQNLVSNLSTEFSNAKIALQGVADEFGQGISPALKEAVGGFTALVNENRETISALGELTGMALKGLITGLNLVLKAIGKVIDLFKGFINIVGDTVTAVKDFKNDVVNQFQNMKDGIGNKMSGVKDSIVGGFQNIYDKVVGNSIVPDMVDDVGKEFDRLAFNADRSLGKYSKAVTDAIDNDVMIQALQRTIGEGFDPLEAKIEVLASGMETFRSTASSSLTDVITGSKKLGDALGEIANATLKALIQGFINLGITIFILEPLEKFLRNQISNQQKLNSSLKQEIALRTVLAFLTGGTSLFGGFRASGGPVAANTAYVVGERGREVFVPNTSGTIVPNEALSDGQAMGGGIGGDNIEVTFNINTIDATDFDQLLTTRQDMIIGLINRGLAERGKRSLTA